MGTSYDDDQHACTVVEAEFCAVSGVVSGLVEAIGSLMRWKDDLLASSAEVQSKSLLSLALISSNLHRSQTQLPSALKGLRKAGRGTRNKATYCLCLVGPLVRPYLSLVTFFHFLPHHSQIPIE
jgi:hypothetical protein